MVKIRGRNDTEEGNDEEDELVEKKVCKGFISYWMDCWNS